MQAIIEFTQARIIILFKPEMLMNISLVEQNRTSDPIYYENKAKIINDLYTCNMVINLVTRSCVETHNLH